MYNTPACTSKKDEKGEQRRDNERQRYERERTKSSWRKTESFSPWANLPR